MSDYQFSDLTTLYPPFTGTLPQASQGQAARLSLLAGAPKPTRDQVRAGDRMVKTPVAPTQRMRVGQSDDVLLNGSLLPPDATAPNTIGGEISKPTLWM